MARRHRRREEFDDLAATLVDARDEARSDEEVSAQALDAAGEILPGGDGPAPEHAPGIREGIGELADALRSGAGAWPLLILGGLNMVDELDRAAFQVLGPRIQEAFALSDAGLGAINSIGVLLFVGAGVAVGHVADRVRRTTVAAIFAWLWAAMVALVAVVRNVPQLALVRVGEGLGKASVLPVHSSLISDYYPVEARARAFALHGIASPLGFVAGALIAGVVGGALGFRWAFIVAAIPTIFLGLACLRLPEPVRGEQERTSLVGIAAAAVGAEDTPTAAPHIPFGSGVSRLLRIRSLYYMYVGFGILGFGLVSAPVLVNLYYEEVWGVGELGRGMIAAIVFSAGLIGYPIGGVLGDRRFRDSPRAGILFVSAAIGAYSAVSPIGLYLPQLWMVVAFQFLAGIGLGVAVPALNGALSVVIPPRLRSLGFALVGLFILLFGGFAGSIIFGAISDATSERFALTLLAPIGVVGALLLSLSALHIRRDVALVAEEILTEERERERIRRGGTPHLLSVRNLDFAYGRTRVLFDVNLDVDDGEIVALLGTNGAGKSTLLRAISGLQPPTRGSVRFDGEDITYLGAEDIVRRGLLQIPGGRMTFPSLTVVENLRTGSYAWRHDSDVSARIEQALQFFPQLADRRTTKAGKLSGGEQQMLALARALVVRPRMLLIDELSLGLAPVVVESLLGVLRQMHADGTTLVLVEQSVNIALTIANRAVFMEKGEIRFEGSARDLLRRQDLLRSVFLEGAGRRT